MEVVMKTKLKIFAIALFAVILGACSSSMQLSKSSASRGDDLYYNPSESYTEESAPKSTSNTSLKIEDLERKYQEILANDSIGSVDTLVYKSEDSGNPYQNILSTSYQESYERRLKGMSNPSYRLNYWTTQYSDDYWYASAYDPSFYNIIVMGSDVWVEPYYISSMFGWPRYGFSSYWGSPWFGRFYSYGYYSFYWGYGYPSYWGYSNPYSYWYSPWNSYYWGYNNGYWDSYYGNNYITNANYHYGRRPSQGTVSSGNRPTVGDNTVNRDRRRDLTDKQVVLGNDQARERKPGSTDQVSTRPAVAKDPNTINATRPVRQEPDRKEVREPVRGNDNAISRPTRGNTTINPTRVNTGNREVSRDYNPTYTRPNPANSSDFNKPTRNYPSTDVARPSSSRPSQPAARPARGTSNQSSGRYSSPPRVNSPSSTKPSRGSSSGNSSVSSPSRSSGGSVRSTPPSRSSSGSSSSSSSSSRSSSSGSRTRTR